MLHGFPVLWKIPLVLGNPSPFVPTVCICRALVVFLVRLRTLHVVQCDPHTEYCQYSGIGASSGHVETLAVILTAPVAPCPMRTLPELPFSRLILKCLTFY